MGAVNEGMVAILRKVATIANEELKSPDKYTKELFAYRKEAAKRYMSSCDDEARAHILEVIEYTNENIKKVLNLW